MLHKSGCRLLTVATIALTVTACSSEQFKRGAYYSIHEKQRQDCLQAGRHDCEQYDYDKYDEYQHKKQQQEN